MTIHQQQYDVATPLFGSLYLPTDDEIALFCGMRDEYARRCRAEPFTNRCSIAMVVGARAFSIPPTVLKATRDQKQPGLVESRQMLMAFSRIVSLQVHPETAPNPWKGIARVFCRTHPCVMHATHKFGQKIAAAMEFYR
jgi:hypothetical protein